MNAATTNAQRQPHQHSPVPWRRVAGVAAGVLAIGALGALVHDVAEPSQRPAVVAESASSGSADVESIRSALRQLAASQVDAVRAALAPDVRAAVDELDQNLADREAAFRASPTIGITEMNGAFWAAAPSTVGITEMNGAFWAAFPPVLIEGPPAADAG